MTNRYVWPGCLPGYVPMGPPDDMAPIEAADEKPAVLAPQPMRAAFAPELPGWDEVNE